MRFTSSTAIGSCRIGAGPLAAMLRNHSVHNAVSGTPANSGLIRIDPSLSPSGAGRGGAVTHHGTPVLGYDAQSGPRRAWVPTREKALIFQAGQRVLFIGDSITDCDRRFLAAPYGDGYMNLVRAFVTARHPQVRLTWLNRGVSGDTVRDLARRWEHDVLALQPDWLSVLIGINDIWRGYEPELAHDAVPI